MGVDKMRMGSRPCCEFNLGHEEKRVGGKEGREEAEE